MSEQLRLIQLQSRLAKKLGRGWNKFRGYVIELAVAEMLRRHIPNRVKVVCSCFIEGCEHEIDLAIVERGAGRLEFDSGYPGAYPRSVVKLLIEVKASGLYYPHKSFEDRLKNWFEMLRKKTGKEILYLTIYESRKKAEMTRKILGKRAFILKQGREVKGGEWKRFIDAVLDTIRPNIVN